MRRSIVVACCLAVLGVAVPGAYAASNNVQKVCIITTGGAIGKWLLVPVPQWATGNLCEAMRGALPSGQGQDTKLGCMVGPDEPDFSADTFHVIGTNSGNPCHWPFVGN